VLMKLGFAFYCKQFKGAKGVCVRVCVRVFVCSNVKQVGVCVRIFTEGVI